MDYHARQKDFLSISLALSSAITFARVRMQNNKRMLSPD